MQDIIAWLQAQLSPWEIFGYLGQALFMSRFIVQWIASERQKKSVIPDAFWYFSLLGGLILTIYAIHTQKPVFILGQAPGIFIYSRNIWLVRQHKKAAVGS